MSDLIDREALRQAILSQRPPEMDEEEWAEDWFSLLDVLEIITAAPSAEQTASDASVELRQSPELQP